MTSTTPTPCTAKWPTLALTLATLGGSALLAPNAQAKMLYVSTTGNDAVTYANNSVTQPWRSVTKAGKSALPGDTVNIGAGNYVQPLKVANSGTSSARIVFKTQSGNRDVTIQRYTVDISGKSYITIKDLIIQNVYKDVPSGPNTIGIAVSGPSKGVTISGNIIVNTSGSAIAAWGTGDYDPTTNTGRTATYDYKGIQYLIVENNIIFNAVVNGWNEAITIANGVDTFFIRNNTLSRSATINNTSGGEAIDIKEGASNGYISGNKISQYNGNMIYLDAGGREDQPGVLTYAASNPPKLKNINVYNNVVSNNTYCICNAIMLAAEGHGSMDGIKIYNNLINNNGGSGVTIYAHPSMKPDSVIANVSIANNSFYNNGWTPNATEENYHGDIDINTENSPNVTANFKNIAIRNNAGFKSVGYIQRGISVSAYELGYVTVSNNSDTVVNDELNGATNPYVNAAARDFRLNAGSSAIDQGAPVGVAGIPSVDITGAVRPKGQGVDIGAYESF